MTTYKPGQVSSLLFASTKKVIPKDDSLAKLFSSPKYPVQNKGHTVLPSSHILIQESSNVKNNGNTLSLKSADRKKEKRKKTREMNSERQVPEENKAAGVKKQTRKEKVGKTAEIQVPEEIEAASEKKQTKKEKREKSADKQVINEAAVKPAYISAPFPYSHETLEQKKQGDITPAKSLKRKLKKDKTDDDDFLGKRPRRDRQRDRQTDNRTIFVGNCPLTADKKELKKLFREFGEIETVRFRCAPSADPSLPRRAIVITKNFHEQCGNFVSYIVFKEEESAQKALVRNGHLLDGLHLRVDIAALSKKHDKKRSVFVGNLPFTISEEMIRSHFSDCGDIINVRIVRDRMTNLGKGICYVQFESKDSIGLALKLNKTEVQGRPIRVMICTNKPKKKEGQEVKKGRHTDKSGKSKTRTMTFAPSNVTSSKFQTVLKARKERRFRKMKKKKENAKKQDGLTSIFGDMPAASKKVSSRQATKDNTGTKKKPHHSVNSFKGKGKENSFKGKGKGHSFKGKAKGSSFKGKAKGSSFKGKAKGSAFKGKGKGNSFKSKGKSGKSKH